MKKTLLITGGSGLVGTYLTQLALAKNYEVRWLGRSINHSNPQIKSFVWDIEKQYIDQKAFDEVDYVVHLAGAGVAEKSWTKQRKTEILESRTKSTALLAKYLIQTNVKKVISASAIGFYGMDTGNHWVDENSQAGTDFLAEVTKSWEDEANKISVPLMKIRIGVVLSNKGGALVKLAEPVKWCVGAGLGTGEQYISWIHIEDMCQLILFGLENENLTGTFNAVAPNPLTNVEITKAIAKKIQKPLILPNVPAFVLKIMLGEMAGIVLGGNKVSAKKVIEAGFKFQYDTIEKALINLNI
ncbi:MAG: TIGR01777 family protein [Bacteroidetes bacterium]|nr:MAG: TIGR01777 family protein [Bacteroidota bacterium]TAG86928.1 MAG: TIGR01777 family protein [Bacteroidota bacterium]